MSLGSWASDASAIAAVWMATKSGGDVTSRLIEVREALSSDHLDGCDQEAVGAMCRRCSAERLIGDVGAFIEALDVMGLIVTFKKPSSEAIDVMSRIVVEEDRLDLPARIYEAGTEIDRVRSPGSSR